jgi:hypothetical protein
LDWVSFRSEVVDMSGAASVDDAGSLSGWLRVTPSHQRARRRWVPAVTGATRLAFYGRISTGEYQDATSSRAWQLDSARQAIAGRGRILEEFFDVGCSRRLPWTERPKAAALLTAATSTDRPFNAVVVGEYERAFHGNQLAQITTALASCGVQLWLPETNGPVDLENPAHQALMMLLAHQSNREILRARFRTTMAMTAQARHQSRHLGGRPPYGYRLVDAGPHPNAAHARWGRRLHRLDPDPITAPHVRWIFAQRRPDTAPPPSPAPSTTAAYRARPVTTQPETSTAAAAPGRCEPSRRSSPIPATPADRYGTGIAPTTTRRYPVTSAPAAHSGTY